MSILGPAQARLRQLWQRDIWVAAANRDRSIRGRFFAVLRVLSITFSGLREVHVAIRAAALSYSSLLSLGPLVALAVLISGFALGNQDPALAARSLTRVLSVIAPQVGQFDKADGPQAAHGNPLELSQPDPELVKLITNFIANSRSGAAGLIGVFTLLVIVVQLFTTIENTFNDIWGVRRGRSWLARIVYYWSAITLGALVFFASLTLLSAGAIMNVFFEKIPLGAQLKSVFVWMLPSSSVVLLIIILTLFYRLVPNTRVAWKSALFGALVVTGLLFLNNYLAFLYFRQVFVQKSLYGSVGILPILMLGLYVFWFFVIVGGQLTYAVQNVNFRSSRVAWHSLNEFTRESLSLLVLLLIARRFKASGPAFYVSEMANHIRMPAQVLNESLNRLCDLGLITQLPPGPGHDPTDYRHQPARPLENITLLEFRHLFENYGDASGGETLDNLDPILADYHATLTTVLSSAIGAKTIDQLLVEHPRSKTFAPFPFAQ
ncbi:MAG TPA: YihY/virulence factor BrkB family protein [Candidatus Didemnitutus sp.]|nr:YihY/virulence factor BrkB family protein [Candidatus Didemnitutus sp.]